MARSRPASAAIALAALACGSDRAPDPRARAMATAITAELGVAVAVRCEATACAATTAAGLVIPIELAADGGWHTAELFDPRALTPAVAAALVDVGADQAVDCGPLRLAADGPARCDLAGGGVALVTVGADGELDVELALTPAIAAVRLAAPDEAALSAASTALDRPDEPGPDDDDDGEAETLDAGLAPGG